MNLLEVSGVTLCNAHKEIKRGKTELSFAHLLYFFELTLGLGLDLSLG